MPRRRTPFKNARCIEFGLKVATRCSDDGHIISVLCLLRQLFRSEDKVGQKRKPAKTTKYFKNPLRVELYRQHVEGQNPSKWMEYSLLSSKEEDAFLFHVVLVVKKLYANFEGEHDYLFFDISPDFFDKIICEFLFDLETDGSTV